MSYLASKYPWSKWKKHLAIWKDPALQPNLPDTAELDEGSLLDFLVKYPVVFAKPSYGGGGKGVIKLNRQDFCVMVSTTSERYQVPLASAYSKIRKLAGRQHYIVQQGVDLLRLDDRPIDFRTLLLKQAQEWRFMGIMGKLAVRKQIVTNHCRGGISITFQEVLQRTKELGEEEIGELEKQMESLSLHIAETLCAKYHLVSELGLDIGIDNDLKLWLIEANTRPQYNLFKDHPDSTLFKRIDGMIRKLRIPITRRSG